MQTLGWPVVFDDGAQSTLQCWGERGPTVLFVHGMTSSRLSWTRLAHRLRDRFRIAAYDQRGHGDSAAVTGPMTLARGVRDLEEVCAALQGRAEPPVYALVGHSWGGAIAIRGGRTLPVARVAAIDPMIRQCDGIWYEEYLDELRQQFALTGSARDELVRAEYADWSSEDVEGKVHAVHNMETEPIEGLWHQNSIRDWDLRPDLLAYEKPLLLAMADRDGSINRTETLEEIERAHAPAVDIVTVANAGHNLHRTHFDALASVLENFLVRGLR